MSDARQPHPGLPVTLGAYFSVVVKMRGKNANLGNELGHIVSSFGSLHLFHDLYFGSLFMFVFKVL